MIGFSVASTLAFVGAVAAIALGGLALYRHRRQPLGTALFPAGDEEKHEVGPWDPMLLLRLENRACCTLSMKA